MGHATPYAELRAMTMDQLVALYNSHTQNTVIGLGFIREEIARRESEAQTVEIIRMTRTMTRLTVAVAAMTLLNLVLVAVAALS